MNGWNKKWAGVRGVAFSVLVGLLSSGGEVVSQELSPSENPEARYEWVRQLPGARQVGSSCGFYANVPALTLVSGINIDEDGPASRAFVRSVYGLRDGDFAMRDSFSKEVFFELFGIPAKGERIYYDFGSKSALLEEVAQLTNDRFDPALREGNLISLRVTGEMDRPHNILVLAGRKDHYLCHDPTTGKIRAVYREELAKRMLTQIECRT